MKQLSVIFVAVCLGWLGLLKPTALFAQASESALSEDIPTVQQAGPHFFSGEDIVLDESLQGDVIVAGQKAIIEGSVGGDLLVAAGEVEIKGEVSQDLRVAGGTVVVSGQIGGNVTVLGGAVTFTEGSVVGNSVIVAAGKVETAGLIAGNSYFAADVVTLDNQFGGDVSVWGNELTILSSAVIAGKIQGQVSQMYQLDQSAQLQQQPDITVRAVDETTAKPSQWQAVSIIKHIVILIMNATLGALLLYFFPRLSQKLSNTVVKGPVVSLGWGFLLLLLSPLTVVFLILTVVGIPLAAMIVLLFSVSLLIAPLISALALGQIISELGTSKKRWTDPYVQLGVGLVIVTILSMIPYLGPVVNGVSLIFGLGSLFIALKASLRSPRTVSKKLTL